MTLNDILTLAKAGYTRNEIEQMDGATLPDAIPTQQPVENPVPATEPTEPAAQVVEPVAVPAPVATPAPTPAPAPAPAEPTMAELMQSIAKLTSAVQANAIAQSVIPGGLSNPPKAEDMLAEIIRPTFKERG